MNVFLEADIFSDDPLITDLDRLAIFRHGLSGRHQLFIKSGVLPSFSAWLRELRAPALVAEVRRALCSSSRLATDSQVTLRVSGRRQDQWSDDVPALTVATTLRLMEMPLYLFVENWESDGAFVRALLSYIEYVAASPHYNDRPAQARCQQLAPLVRRLLEEQWAEFDHGGGTPNMVQRLRALRELAAQGYSRALRMWVLTDSDGEAPAVQSLAEELNMPRYMLQRREIENYLPLARLKAHVEDNRLPRPMRQELSSCLDELRRLSHAERCTVDMKERFERKVTTRGEGVRRQEGFTHTLARRYQGANFPAAEWDLDPAPQAAEVLAEALKIFEGIVTRR